MVQTLDGPITHGELTKALIAMANGKSPGPDGIITELYKVLWPVMGIDYYNMILEAIQARQFHEGVTEGLIALLHKGGGWSTLNNRRPITLLNVAYKVFAKALQLRLQPVLAEVISQDQSAFLPMRFILDNILLTYETIHEAKVSNQPLLFLKLDFSKAYDKVDWKFLFSALTQLGFPESFILMTQLLFTNAAAHVSVNGKTTKPFSIQ